MSCSRLHHGNEGGNYADGMAARAESPSLHGWLQQALSPDERQHIALVSLNQWPYFNAVVGEIALTAHTMGSQVSVGMWADNTPLPDPGWTTSRALARLVGSRAVDETLERALVASGLHSSSIARPPLQAWTPSETPKVPDQLTRGNIRALRFHGSPMGRSILQVHPDNETPIRESHIWPKAYTEAAITSYAWVYDQVTEFIREREITTLVVYNGRFTHDQAAAAAAEAAGIRVLYFDAGGLETGFDLTFSTTHDWADLQNRMLRMWDSWPQDEREHIGAEWFMNRQNHREPGIRFFVEFQERGNLDGVPKDARPLVAFFSSSPDEQAELDVDWNEYFGSQPEALEALATAVNSVQGAQLVVRTHPHMRLKPKADLSDWREAVRKAKPTAHFDADDAVDSYALMKEADIVVTYGSTSGVEAAFIGKPVIVMGPSAYDLLGCVTRVQTADEVQALIKDPPATSPTHALPFGLMMQRRGFNFEFVHRNPDGTYELAGRPLHEAAEISRKLSHRSARRRLHQLLK